MSMNRTFRRMSAVIASFAILFASLWPSVSYAMSSKQSGQSWIEICSVSGSKMVKADETSSPESPAPVKAGLHSGHCSLCATHGKSWAPSSSAVIAVHVSPAGYSMPALFAQSPQPLFIWSAPQSRAPPAVS